MTTEYRDLLPVIVETTGSTLPEGFDSWGLKAVHTDLMTTHGFRWALPGGLNLSNHAFNLENTSPCPSEPGDGLCVATTWRGMASGGIPARTLLLVAYRAADVAGRGPNKLRIKGVVASVALIDGERLIREHGKGTDLHGADLRGADLQGADLQGADLRGADLRGAGLQHADLRGAKLRGAKLQRANLRGADLQGADLQGAYLQRADLEDADLRDANLQGADLRDANLHDADLQGANLFCADLQGADLQRADLRDTNLSGADLQGADLQGADPRGADLQGAVWPASIALPDGWTLTSDGRLTREVTR